MRVLFIWHAGVVAAYRERFRALRRLNPNLDLHVLLPDQSFEGGQWVSYEPHDGDDYYIHRPGSVWTSHPNGMFYKLWLRDLRRINPDIVHVHEEAWTLSALQMTLSFSPRVPLVIESFENLMRPIKWPFRHLEPFVMKKANGFVAVTPAVKRVLLHKGVSQPIDVIPYGSAAPGPVGPRTRNERLRVAFVGRLTAEKGIGTLFEAVPLLKSSVEIIVVGRGPLAGSVNAMVAAYRGVISWIPGIHASTVIDFLKSMDVLVLPSVTTATWAEQFGRVLVEAMSVGTVPVGSDSGEIPWVIGDAGLVFPEGQAVDLAAALDTLADDRERWEALSRRARERFAERFTWEGAAQRLMNFYRRLL